MSSPAADLRSAWLPPVAVVAVLALYGVGRTVALPDGWHPWVNASLGVAMVGVGRAAGLDRAAMGLSRERLPAGLALGGIVWAVVAAGLAVAALVPAAEEWLVDDRADVGVGELLRVVLVRIPFGTVLLEEVAFRAVLLGLLLLRTSPTRALLGSALLFGLWHLPSTVHDGSGSVAAQVGAVVGVLLVTSAAGVGFGWLRLRSGSLAAPVLAHVATNSTAFLASWLVQR